ncbi:MAG TPA: hypothetical protein VEI97_02890, partial [bacterium]|nr:hypothetical protein [bacterium]
MRFKGEPMFWQHIASNKTKTFILMFVFFLLLAVMVWALGAFLNGGSSITMVVMALLFSGI